MYLGYPYRYDATGRTAKAAEEVHVRDLIEQVLFTAPGERVMRPDFGSGVYQLVFAPNSPQLAGAVQMLVQGALQKWLSDVATMLDVQVEAAESELRVVIAYELRRDGRRVVETFVRPVTGAP
jgi:phage baseplate assembly protein W